MKLPTFIAGCACALASCLSASAQVLMLDFGPTAATGGNLTNSPYHTANGSFTGNTWNMVQTSDAGSGLLWSDNTAATGVNVNVGATTAAGVTTIGLASAPSGTSALGTVVNTGVYTGTSVGTDGIFTGTSGQSRAVGLQIGGLAAGTYDIYVTGRNTNISAAHVQNFYAGKSSSAADFDFSAYTTKALSFGNTSTSATSSWTDTANYVKFSVTLTSGEFLNIASIGGTGEDIGSAVAIDSCSTERRTRGFLNAIQIVNTAAVPEPAAAASFVALAAAACAAFRRKHRA